MPDQDSAIPEALVARWRRIPVAVAVDLAPEAQVDPLIRPLRPAGAQPPLCARAATARCVPPDFGAVLRALNGVGPGRVLVIDAGGHAANAMIGDVLGGQLARQGAAGIVCDGAIRDTATLAGLDGFGVWSRSVNPRGPVGAAEGVAGVPVVVGACPVSPGDLVLGDDDGLAVLSAEAALLLIDAAEAKLRLEAEWTARLAAGDLVEGIFGLD